MIEENTMTFDIKATLSSMLGAMNNVISSDWPKVRDCVKKALAEEQQALETLAKARLSGEIDDAMLAAQLDDEKETLKSVLLVCEVIGKKMVQDAANAAIDVFNNAIKTAIGSLFAGTKKKTASTKKFTASERKLNARPDTLDFRDLMYVPTLVEVGTSLPLDNYRKANVPILDQGREGACTGFGLATVAHYLLRTRKIIHDKNSISPWMFYTMARRYDEWAGETYEGSSCRGAMKGWNKHGVCSANLWRHDPHKPDHSLSIGNNGQLRTTGNIATSPQQVKKIFQEDFPKITATWKKRRIVLFAHGGLVGEDAAVQRIAEYRQAMLDAECYLSDIQVLT